MTTPKKKLSPVANAIQHITNVITTTRAAWLRGLFDGQLENVDKECGHPALIAIREYERLYRRGDLAKRVVNIYPEESWGDNPEIYENEDEETTEFEIAWQEICDRLYPYSALLRADCLSGVGRFGVLLLGFGDGLAMNLPVAGVNPDGTAAPNTPANGALNFIRPFDETFVRIKTLEQDQTNPRFGRPLMYSISFGNINNGEYANEDGEKSENVMDVHWTRVIHLADNRGSSELYGAPRMEVVWNRLLDLRKIAGGSAEMFWKGGFPGLSIEAMPLVAGEEIDFDEEATQKQIDEYQRGLTRYLALIGAQAKVLAPNIADPTPSLNVQLTLIATAIACPWRIFIGSEQAQLASEQDSRAWMKRINRRRTNYINPYILRPLIDRLMATGVLPPIDKYVIDWPGLNESNDKEKSEIALADTQAMAAYMMGGCDALMPPFQYLTLVLGYTDDEATSIVNAATKLIADEEKTGELGDSNAQPEDDDSNA